MLKIPPIANLPAVGSNIKKTITKFEDIKKQLKKITKIILILTTLIVSNDLVAQSNSTTYKKPSYTTSQTKKQTYNVGGTNYIHGETYKTTGHPKVKRSSSAKNEFLKSKGYSKVPNGYQVDHIIPLSQGGRDVPSNMQLITIEQHKQKTAMEKRNVSTTYSNKSYNYSIPKSSKITYRTPSYNYSTPKSSYSTKSYSSGSRRK